MESSSEEEKLLQMVQDFIESESSNSTISIPESFQLSHQESILFSLQDIVEKGSNAENEVLEKILLYLQEIEDDRVMGKIKNLRKWIIVRLKADNYKASLCETSWVSTFGSPSVYKFTGGYEYIEVMMHENGGDDQEEEDDDDDGGCRLIVDVDFKSQFELARPTQEYSELIELLPPIFVGTEEKLNKIVSLICPEAKRSLKQSGLHIPPWRKASYMHSKWLSHNCKKLST